MKEEIVMLFIVMTVIFLGLYIGYSAHKEKKAPIKFIRGGSNCLR